MIEENDSLEEMDIQHVKLSDGSEIVTYINSTEGASEHMDPFFKQVSIDNDDSFNLELRKDWPSSLDLLSDSTDFTETQTPQTPQNLDTSKETTHAPGDLDEILKYFDELKDLNT